MKKSSLSILFLIVFGLVSACNQISEPIVIITPEPLPTTVLQQATRFYEASETPGAESVDFVIDTNLLEKNGIPYQLTKGDNWYKYTSPEGDFSVLIPGGQPPAESIVTAENPIEAEIFRVESHNLGALNQQYIDYYDMVSSDLTEGEIFGDLDKYVLYERSNVDGKIVEDRQIQLNDTVGRELVLNMTSMGNPDIQFPMYARIFIEDGRFYQLYTVGIGEFGENDRLFLDSFVLNVNEE